MATAAGFHFNFHPASNCFSIHSHISRNLQRISIAPLYGTLKLKSLKKMSVAAAESSESLAAVEPDPQIFLRQLADSFVLPSDYFSKLPRDLRLDLNDAAFDLSNGCVKDECGEEVGEILLNASRAWELAETSTSANLMSKLPLLVGSITSLQKSALGKRLVSAGMRFQSMGQYGQGELQMIAKRMTTSGKLLSVSSVSNLANEEPKQESRVLKFGELQVEITPRKAYTGAVIGVVFGFLSWQLSLGIQSVPDSSLEYANDNALLLAKSLRGALLALSYSTTILSAFAAVGLVLLAGQQSSKEN